MKEGEKEEVSSEKGINSHIGSSFNDFLKREGILKEVNAGAQRMTAMEKIANKLEKNSLTRWISQIIRWIAL